MVRRSRQVGAVAQLGERELCKLEVVGSIPISSMNSKLKSERSLKSAYEGKESKEVSDVKCHDESSRQRNFTGFAAKSRNLDLNLKLKADAKVFV